MLKKLTANLLPIAIFTTITLSPLYVLRCKSFSWCPFPLPTTLLEILIIITILIWVFGKFRDKKALNPKIILEKIPLILKISFIILLFSAAIGVLVAEDKTSAFGAFKAYFVEPMVFAWVCFDYLIEKKNNKLIILALVFTAIWLGFLAFLEQIFHFSLANQNEYLLRGRVSGVYITSNALALFLEPTLLIILGKFFDLSKDSDKLSNLTLNYFLTAGIIVSAIGMLLSGSRGGIFGAFCGVVLFILLKKIIERNNQKLIIIFQRIIKYLLPILVIFSVIILFNAKILVDINNKNKIFPEINSRLCLWDGSTKLIREKVVFGVGLANFQETYKDYRTCSQEVINYPHNLFLNFWTEIGIFGLISFITLIFSLCYLILKKTAINFTSIGIICALAVIFIHGLVDVPYFKNDLSLVFWIIVALALYEIDYQSFVVKHRFLRLNPRR